jgi:hypothetical protein
LNKSSTRAVRFWAGWTLYSELGGLVALALAAEIPPFISGVLPSGDEANITGYGNGWAVVVAGLLFGVIFGSFQWFFLRSWFAGQRSAGWWWIAASALAVGVSFTLAWVLGDGIYGDNFAQHGLPHAVDRAGIWGGALIGTMLGLGQWLALWSRQPGLAIRAGWWIAANIIAFALGWWITAILSVPVAAALGPLNHFWGGAVFGTIFGLITGICLTWLKSYLVAANRGLQKEERPA